MAGTQKRVELKDARAGVAVQIGQPLTVVVKPGKFQVEAALEGAGGAPLANERIRIRDPDTGEHVGDAVTTDELGVVRAEVPAEKHYEFVVENESAEEEKLPALADHLPVPEILPSPDAVLCVELLDADREPMRNEKVTVKGDEGPELETATDAEGWLHLPVEPGPYTLTVRGKALRAHSIFPEDRSGTEAPYRAVLT